MATVSGRFERWAVGSVSCALAVFAGVMLAACQTAPAPHDATVSATTWGVAAVPPPWLLTPARDPVRNPRGFVEHVASVSFGGGETVARACSAPCTERDTTWVQIGAIKRGNEYSADAVAGLRALVAQFINYGPHTEATYGLGPGVHYLVLEPPRPIAGPGGGREVVWQIYTIAGETVTPRKTGSFSRCHLAKHPGEWRRAAFGPLHECDFARAGAGAGADLGDGDEVVGAINGFRGDGWFECERAGCCVAAPATKAYDS